MARPLSMDSDKEHTKINVSVKGEIKRFLIENNISPSDIISRHVENLRELASYRFERILAEKETKIQALQLKIQKCLTALIKILSNEAYLEFIEKL